VRLVHRHGAEAALPEMAAAALARMDMAGIAAVELGERPPEPVGVARAEDEVDMVRHQHPGPDLDLSRAAGYRQEIAIERIVGIAEEGLRPPVATLRHVMRQAGDDETGEARHG